MNVRTMLIKDSKPQFLATKIKPSRAAWVAASVGSLSIAPMGYIAGQNRLYTGKSNGWSTIGYSFVSGLQFTAVSLVSIVDPSIGRKYRIKGIIDVDDLYANNPVDGVEQFLSKVTEKQFTCKKLTVHTDKGELDAVEISHKDSKDDRILIRFCGSGHNYQEVAHYLFNDAKELSCKIIVANYPGVTNRKYKVSSTDDLTNVGIALVDDTAKRYHLADEEIEDQIILDGFSLGGGVAVTTAAQFKDSYNVNIPVFVNRSFWSYIKVSGAFYNTFCGLPMSYGEKLQKLYDYACGGNLDIDSAAAVKLLDPDVVDCFNVENDFLIPKSTGFADVAKSKNMAEHYLKWNGKGDPDFKFPRPVVEHIAPNQTLFHPTKPNLNGRDYFRLFADRMWNRNKNKRLADEKQLHQPCKREAK